MFPLTLDKILFIMKFSALVYMVNYMTNVIFACLTDLLLQEDY